MLQGLVLGFVQIVHSMAQNALDTHWPNGLNCWKLLHPHAGKIHNFYDNAAEPTCAEKATSCAPELIELHLTQAFRCQLLHYFNSLQMPQD